MPMTDNNTRFLLSMQMIVDEFDEFFPHMRFYKGDDSNILEGIRFYYGQSKLESRYLYIADGKDLNPDSIPEVHCSFVSLGEAPKEWIAAKHSILTLPETLGVLRASDACQAVFQKVRIWSDKLREILIHGGSVDDLCRTSYEYFKNPLFVHDAQLYVISCPVWREGMIKWVKDERTGLTITPLDVINEFKTDHEYLHTMTTHGAQIFSASLRGYRDIYVNLWDEYGRYEGRLCVCELETPFKPGQLSAALYLADLITLVLSRKNRLDNTYNHALELLMDNMLKGEQYPEDEISSRIAQYGWNLHDDYVCIRMNSEQHDQNLLPIVSMCNHIEASISGSKALCDETRICIIINLTINDHYNSDVACILREGLFKAGISNIFHDFTKLGDYYRQASIALHYCRKINDTRWSVMFNEISLDYMIDTSCPDIGVNYICSSELIKLLEYDKENVTDLYQTLKVYIENERNTVKTSKELFISRSTLFYRLQKIREITGLDTNHLSVPKLNLYLRLSFYLLERKKIT
ncbi:MAG: helix-turn-helix domain-containing protein [Lachnospiraceae bacterium]|nr:helix-turn-helix domain-containing protein [Lachnospiraceae bacterium]